MDYGLLPCLCPTGLFIMKDRNIYKIDISNKPSVSSAGGLKGVLSGFIMAIR